MPDPESQQALDLLEANFSDEELFGLHHEIMVETHQAYMETVADIYEQRESALVAEERPRLKRTATEFFVAFDSLAQAIAQRHTREAGIMFLTADITLFDRTQSAAFSEIAGVSGAEALQPVPAEKVDPILQHMTSTGLTLAGSSRSLLTDYFVSNLFWILNR